MKTSSTGSSALASEQSTEKYNHEGYILERGALTFRDIEPLRMIVDRHIERFAQELRASGKISDLCGYAPFETRLARLVENQSFNITSWDDIIFSPQLHRLITHPKLLDILEPLLGPDITFQGDYRLRPKLPNSKAIALPWHQDTQYYGEPTKNMRIITVVVPLVNIPQENGCLWVIPGSHKWGFFQAKWEDSSKTMHMSVDAETEAIKRGSCSLPIPMEIGDLLVFGNMLLHGSKLNTSQEVRWTLDLRYSTTRRSREPFMDDAERAAYDFRMPEMVRRASFIVRGEGSETWEQWFEKCRSRSFKIF